MTKILDACKMSDSEIGNILKLLLELKSKTFSIPLICTDILFEYPYSDICIDYSESYISNLRDIRRELEELIGEDMVNLFFSEAKICQDLTKESVREFLIQNKFA